jgi:hypothetical protein
MPQKTLTDLFPNAHQDAMAITLMKGDLGLSDPDASLDKIIAAIILALKPVLTQENFNQEFDQNLYLTEGFGESLTTKNDGTSDVRFLVEPYIINLARPISLSAATPEDY